MHEVTAIVYAQTVYVPLKRIPLNTFLRRIFCPWGFIVLQMDVISSTAVNDTKPCEWKPSARQYVGSKWRRKLYDLSAITSDVRHSQLSRLFDPSSAFYTTDFGRLPLCAHPGDCGDCLIIRLIVRGYTVAVVTLGY